MIEKVIAENLKKINHNISEAASKTGRTREDITLVAVTKQRPPEYTRILYKLGVRNFGENRVDAAIEKCKQLQDLDDIVWHMIGNLQSRKVDSFLSTFDYFHALDREKIAIKLGRNQVVKNIPILLQFNVSGEASKSGWSAENENTWDELLSEINPILSIPNLNIQGLMMMAPYGVDSHILKGYFRRLKKLQGFLIAHIPQINWNHLSMGMSNDYISAIEEGATIIRVGTAIFK